MKTRHEHAKHRNGPGPSPDKAASVSVSASLSDNAAQQGVPTSVISTDQELKLNLKSSCPITEIKRLNRIGTSESFVRVDRDASCVARMFIKKTRHVRGKTSPPNVLTALETISPRRQTALSSSSRKKYKTIAATENISLADARNRLSSTDSRSTFRSSTDLGSTRSVHFANDDYHNFPLKNGSTPHSFVSYDKFSPLENADISRQSYAKVSAKSSTSRTSPEHPRSQCQGAGISRPQSPPPSSLRSNDKLKQDLSNVRGTPSRNTNNTNYSTSLEEARREYLISPNGRSPNISGDAKKCARAHRAEKFE
ncbi:hypothetical protein G5I_01912 [Acromyrmex echinatior]|uniref:Uncharacterized protein n=1 Tax=Acromyrmex echinatior TaxID=103372 RepID=F4W8X0_ACREC|nr:hypothetical protein G5I_01912 [Acromyrmex echinatior]